MNKSFIRYILGTILKAEGVFLLLPVIIAAIYREGT
jgi:trk system potassium uptake protein TrkH